uniref:RecA family profile 1 domain-containing protein n=1 Tax=Tetradesmus obliquus TaxID=3088 RepID=A0A383VW69_TETOB|eukprot:jgi/Sobl393_1/18911/SZX69042.1
MAAEDLPLKWVTPDETAAEFLARQFRESVSTGLPFLDKHVKLRPGHLLEIIGPAGTAKTEILTEIAANIMTKAAAATAAAAGGQTEEQEHVVVIDCDGKFDTLKLLQLVTGRLPPSAVATQSLQQLGTALERFHLFRCFSSMELLLAINSLPSYLAQLQGRCRLLLVDNISAYVWHDRAAAASSSGSHNLTSSAAAAPPYTPGFQGPVAAAAAAGLSAQRVQAAAAALLTELSQVWRLPVVVSKQAGVSLEERHDGPPRLVQRELMTLPWQNAVTHRLLLAPVMMPGQALQQLAAKGPAATELMMQWQAQGNTAPIERCAVTANATISC